MTRYNVKVPVVELIDADTKEQAIDQLQDRLRDAGFDVSYAVDGRDSDAFESDDQPVAIEHEHTYLGQTLRHAHEGGDTPHHYFGHIEDFPPVPIDESHSERAWRIRREGRASR